MKSCLTWRRWIILIFRMRFYQKMAKEGLFSLLIPKEYGGHFTDSLTYALAIAAIAKADAGLTVAMSVTNMVAEAIAKHGTEEQIVKYLPKITSGEYIPASFALTEKQAGSDARNIQTKAEANGEYFIINGEKQFISECAILLGHCHLCQNQQRHNSFPFFVDKGTEGFTITKKERKLGLLSANLVGIALKNWQLLKNQILGKSMKKGISWR